MWTRFAHFILKFQVLLLLVILGITIGMLYLGNVERAYDYASVVPDNHPEMKYFKAFKKKYGEDGNILAIGMRDSTLFELKTFKALYQLTNELKRLDGVSQVLSLSNTQYLKKNTEEERFDFRPIFEPFPQNQKSLDSSLHFFSQLKFYHGQIINMENGASLILISIEDEALNTAKREEVIAKILEQSSTFEKENHIHLYYGGLPYIRSILANQVTQELRLFLVLSLLTTALILFIFFRSISAVIVPLIIIGIVIIWTLGILGLFGYKITLLTGLLPPILVVIGIPNCVYLLNKYHHEYRIHGNKVKALSRIIRKIGIVSLITNATTAIGFVVLSFTNIVILKEFGIVSGICIFCTFLISIILFPIFFYYLPSPKKRHLKHLDGKALNGVLHLFQKLISQYRSWIYAIVIGLALIAVFGIYQIKTVSFMVDDIPKESRVKEDLKFFENNFGGIMPLEIVINTGKKKGLRVSRNLQLIEQFQSQLDSLKISSPALSMVTFIKAAKQAYYNNNPDFYTLPNNREIAFIYKYLKDRESQSDYAHFFVDKDQQEVRISMKIPDVGSIKLDSLVKNIIEPAAEKTFKSKSDFEVHTTGTSVIFIKGNKYLISNLKTSLLLAFVLVALIMALLFGSVRMIFLSIIPNILPLIITAGIMGYFGIPLKPSTALIFSIAFGISIDDSIHFLAKYRQELFTNHFNVKKAVAISLKETGSGMIYTSVILFFGFVIFVGSSFGGTIALGLLTSLTLALAMITNLIFLPSLLLSFDSGKYRKNTGLQLIEHYDEFYVEDDDEEIDIDAIEIKKEDID